MASRNHDTASHLEKLAELPESLQTEVLHYIEFLIEKQAKNSTQETPTKRGGLGIWKDKIRISDDFDEPIEDLND
ncbi:MULTISPECIES: type II toxin-antitoxin system VapB family antitoxin [unclassified Microcoleus]|uniref:type II toxin-antitoxin system VapB family antitoxin n=1 Tax=unclassified Microcoleus TaxID=2642155 RepID=UPI002FD216F7